MQTESKGISFRRITKAAFYLEVMESLLERI
jgi:hypothetical protein